ncbi:15295_t:CDS:2 [Funneliformis mosseae]|uniref:15295_t:CDS:1 n=1 Tax=Funneliformis mosseae TaxID=27381 RepID=A0A9N9DCI5_FUNMO|nr:15295_t:CDS:2 [Funneliformis mosseae]
MNNPLDEISNVLYNIFTNPDKSALEKEVKRTFTHNSEFKHFLATVPAGIGSREKIISHYKFFRGFYRSNTLDIHEKWFNEPSGRMVLDVTEYIQFIYSPWRQTPLRLYIIFNLQKNEGGKYFINRHEDLCQPEDLLGVYIPYVAPTLLVMTKRAISFITMLVGSTFNSIGWC